MYDNPNGGWMVGALNHVLPLSVATTVHGAHTDALMDLHVNPEGLDSVSLCRAIVQDLPLL